MKRVVVFGIFDGVHEGHRSLFLQAREHGDELIAIVGRDEVCEELKHKTPRHTQGERVKLVQAEPLVDRAILGDRHISTYEVLREWNPRVVCLGYDQQALFDDLSAWLKKNSLDIQLVTAKPFKPEVYQNSLIQKGS